LILVELKDQIQFIEAYLPLINNYSSTPKIHLAYNLQIERFRRDSFICRRGQMLDAIFIIKSGDCSVVVDEKALTDRVHLDGKRKLAETIKLSVGTCIGEECVLLGIPCDNSIKVMSDIVVCYFLPRLGIRKAAPSRVLDALKDNYEAKRKCRELMRSHVRLPQGTLVSEPIYSLASPVARKKLLKLTTHRSSMDRLKSAESLKRWPVIDIAKSRGSPALDKGHKRHNSVSMTQFKCAVMISGLNSPKSRLHAETPQQR
jgi:CRP-like cAMP-binding protein